MLSTSQMIDRLAGMVGTKDLTDWETRFVQSLIDRIESPAIAGDERHRGSGPETRAMRVDNINQEK